jgi:hypothetical protein
MNEPRQLPAAVKRVRTLTDFIAYLEDMAADFEADREETELHWRQGDEWYTGRWTIRNVDDFLRQWAACLRADWAHGVGTEPLTWQSLALQIHSARVYG